MVAESLYRPFSVSISTPFASKSLRGHSHLWLPSAERRRFGAINAIANAVATSAPVSVSSFSKVKSIKLRHVVDSRGNPTVEADLETDGVYRSGMSSIYEALMRSDGEKSVYGGEGVKNIDCILAPNLLGFDLRLMSETIMYKGCQSLINMAVCMFPGDRQHLNARISASLDSGEGKADDARKALEQMFQGKTSISKKWEEEIKKRELGGGDGRGSGSGSGGGGGRGRGWGGGSDDMAEDPGSQEEPWDWEEAGQTFIATSVLIFFYLSITHGPKQVFRIFKLFFRWVRQGFTLRSIPKEFLEGPDTEDEEDENGDSGNYSYDEILPKREPYEPISDTQMSNVQNNSEPGIETGMEAMDEYSYPSEPPPEYKRGSRITDLQAQQKEKMMQMLMDRDRRERGK